jgi:hypothetical protein
VRQLLAFEKWPIPPRLISKTDGDPLSDIVLVLQRRTFRCNIKHLGIAVHLEASGRQPDTPRTPDTGSCSNASGVVYRFRLLQKRLLDSEREQGDCSTVPYSVQGFVWHYTRTFIAEESRIPPRNSILHPAVWCRRVCFRLQPRTTESNQHCHPENRSIRSPPGLARSETAGRPYRIRRPAHKRWVLRS